MRTKGGRTLKVLSRLVEHHPALAGLTISNLVSNGTTFAILLLVSALLLPDQFGALTILVSVLMQLSFLLDMGTGIALVRFYNAEQQQGPTYISAVLLVRVVIAVAFLLFALPSVLLLQDRFPSGIDSHLALLTVASALVMSWWNYLRSLNQAQQNFSAYGVSQIGLSVLRWAGIGVLFSVQGQNMTVFQIVAYLYLVAPFCIIVIAALFSPYSRLNALRPFSSVVVSAMGQILRYGRWIFASSLLFPLSVNIPLWWLGMSANLEAAGSLGIGMYFANAMAPVREAIKVYMLPKVAGFDSVVQADSYIRNIVSRMHYALPVAVVLSAAAAGLQYFLNGDRYADAYGVIVIMIATQVVTMFTTLIGSVLHYFGQPQFDVLVNVVRVLLALTLSALLVPSFGALAAAVIGMVTTLAGEFLIYRRVRSIIRRELTGSKS